MKIDLFGNIIPEVSEEDVKVKKISPFEYTNAIGMKAYPSDLSGYNAFLTNLSFSQRNDTIFFANEMNKYHSLPDEAQFDFYYYALPKKKYFAKWAKAIPEDSLEHVADYYNVSKKVAREYLRVLSDDQIKQIIKWSNNKTGGKNKR